MPNKPEKINLSDINSRKVDENLLNELRELFAKAEEQKERYDFTWNGKAKAYFEAASPTTKTLCPQSEESVNFENTENLFITGDNLETLKLLQESYLGKIDMIYIDPPYNTGNDFVYCDNFKISKKESDLEEGNIDEEGNRLIINEKSSGRYHSTWLSMMYPRLKLARNLLCDSGVIFVSIDDKEVANLKLLMDEIYGENNFIDIFSWQKTTTPANLSKKTKKSLEYILAYFKNNSVKLQGITKYSSSSNGLMNQSNKVGTLRFPENTVNTKLSNGKYIAGVYGTKSYEIELLNDTEVLDGKFIKPIKLSGKFKWSQEYLDESIKNGVELYIQTKAFSPSYIKEEYEPEKPWNFINGQFGVGTNENAGNELDSIFKQNFSDNLWPKPTTLLKYLFNMVHNKNAVILDFFAGSGSTADAVMQMNAEDGGKRKYIVATLDEPTSQDSEVHKEGYETIDQIARERIRRVAKKLNDNSGFRALKVDNSKLKDNIYKTAVELEQEQLLMDIDNESDKRSEFELLYDVLIDGAFEYNRKINIESLNDEKIIKYDYFGELSGVVAYFGRNLTEELTRKIATLKPLIVVFREASFDMSAQKVNVMEQFRIISPDTKVKVI